MTYSRRLVGTSGWVYRSWRETVYPAGTPQGEWLRHYATLFPIVEVNATFDRLAAPATVARWAAEVPSRFHGLAGGYAHDYTDDELAPWARFVEAAPAALVYFNNDAMGMASRTPAASRSWLPRAASAHRGRRHEAVTGTALPMRSTKLSW